MSRMTHARQIEFLVAHGRMEYPFPLSDGTVAELLLPLDLSAEDADRIAEFVRTLVVAEEDA